MKNNPNWMTYWDNVDIGLYALIKHVKKQNKMSKEKIELKVTWRGMMQSYLLFLEMGDDNNRAYATRELMKLADKLDKYNEENDIPYGYLKPKQR